ncbi:MAG: hypothetical protein KF691_01700 [Phycisphaeraceae bacterium]|nr:hypothetical protein [Phycisphaeraceae bacterium]
MTTRSVVMCLLGSRREIEAIANSRWALPVGLLFVFSGGVARYYDNAYLPAEWHVLLRGIGVTLINSFVLFGLACVFAAKADVWKQWGKRYLAFLGLFWISAPMAWLYGIPYEQFLSPVDAVRANAWTLSIVSAWRVLFAARILSNLLGVSFAAMVFPVLFFSNAAVLVATSLMPRPLFDLMGGMQLTEVEREIANRAIETQAVATIAIIPLALAMLLAAALARRTGAMAIVQTSTMPKGALVFAGSALVIWINPARAMLPEQERRYRAESALRGGRIEEGLRELSRHVRADYPPAWEPPPVLLYQEKNPSMASIREAIRQKPPAPWVLDLYAQKSLRELGMSMHLYGQRIEFERLPVELETEANVRALRFHLDFDRSLSSAERRALGDAVERITRNRK